uniref:Putative similar to chymotrypsin-elastase inhibitor ixodidin n=1 Tax=Rhipicephalus pulchellus TaxID=72859 RepID=L7M962_RHIPC
MAWNSQMIFALWLTVCVLVLSTSKCEGWSAENEAIKNSCKPGEHFGCISGSPGCGENECGVEFRSEFCTYECLLGCWCTGNLYRRKIDNKCVPKHECLLFV